MSPDPTENAAEPREVPWSEEEKKLCEIIDALRAERDALGARLDEIHDAVWKNGTTGALPTKDIAEAIAALHARLAEAEEERDEARAECIGLDGDAQEWRIKADAAREEVEKLREFRQAQGHANFVAFRALRTAREALESRTEAWWDQEAQEYEPELAAALAAIDEVLGKEEGSDT